MRLWRAALSLCYVLKYVGETALSGLLMFSAASLLRNRRSRLWSAWETAFLALRALGRNIKYEIPLPKINIKPI